MWCSFHWSWGTLDLRPKMSQLLMVAHLLCLYKPTQEWQPQFQWIHVKTFYPDVVMFFSLLWACFSLAASPCFFSLLAPALCANYVSSVTSSHLSMSMSLLLMSLKWKWSQPFASGQFSVQEDLRNPPISKNCYFLCFAVWHWSVHSNVQVLATLYDKLSVAHAACLSSLCHQSCVIWLGTGVITGVARMNQFNANWVDNLKSDSVFKQKK